MGTGPEYIRTEELPHRREVTTAGYCSLSSAVSFFTAKLPKSVARSELSPSRFKEKVCGHHSPVVVEVDPRRASISAAKRPWPPILRGDELKR